MELGAGGENVTGQHGCPLPGVWVSARMLLVCFCGGGGGDHISRGHAPGHGGHWSINLLEVTLHVSILFCKCLRPKVINLSLAQVDTGLPISRMCGAGKSGVPPQSWPQDHVSLPGPLPSLGGGLWYKASQIVVSLAEPALCLAPTALPWPAA